LLGFCIFKKEYIKELLVPADRAVQFKVIRNGETLENNTIEIKMTMIHSFLFEEKLFEVSCKYSLRLDHRKRTIAMNTVIGLR